MAATTVRASDQAIRPFTYRAADAALEDLRKRIAATRWPDQETVSDRSQGAQLAKVQAFTRYWASDYDWRKLEARMEALPQFVTEIDGLDIHFILVRSPHSNALPLIMTHGWPGSFLEFMKVIGPLSDPETHGARAEDAFDLVVPSLPGFGFSARPRAAGWNPERIAGAWIELMRRLGYRRYVAQGGDWGALVTDVMGRLAPKGLLGIHVTTLLGAIERPPAPNRPTTVPPAVANALKTGGPPPAGLSAEETIAFEGARSFAARGSGFRAIQGTCPETIGYALADSPVGLAAWFYEKFAAWTDSGGEPERALTKDDMLDDITLYWLTNTAASSARIYWEDNADKAKAPGDVSIPAAVSRFPREIIPLPRSWAERAYPNLIYFNELDKGGHFAAWEQPDLFAGEMRAAFRSLR
ncbi:MAG TPA: alpha/beta fold hydrolase [Caulobacteraceae bacterium]|jgi:pimeloyl-ACP methyl ester carboxylesterase|nr:alpha/beta fold hydrolase [Caulobacteraceae bacterium]